MWQSKSWNGQDAAFRMFTMIGIVLLLVALPDAKGSPKNGRRHSTAAQRKPR